MTLFKYPKIQNFASAENLTSNIEDTAVIFLLADVQAIIKGLHYLLMEIHRNKLPPFHIVSLVGEGNFIKKKTVQAGDPVDLVCTPSIDHANYKDRTSQEHKDYLKRTKASLDKTYTSRYQSG